MPIDERTAAYSPSRMELGAFVGELDGYSEKKAGNPGFRPLDGSIDGAVDIDGCIDGEAVKLSGDNFRTGIGVGIRENGAIGALEMDGAIDGATEYDGFKESEGCDETDGRAVGRTEGCNESDG